MVEKHEFRFLVVGFLAKHILRIIGSKIEIKRNFHLARILTSLKGCWLRCKNLNKLIFCSSKLAQ